MVHEARWLHFSSSPPTSTVAVRRSRSAPVASTSIVAVPCPLLIFPWLTRQQYEICCSDLPPVIFRVNLIGLSLSRVSSGQLTLMVGQSDLCDGGKASRTDAEAGLIKNKEISNVDRRRLLMVENGLKLLALRRDVSWSPFDR